MYRNGQLEDPWQKTQELMEAEDADPLALAELWLALDAYEQAMSCALFAYELAWADGEPYVRRYDLERSRAILKELGVPVPDLPPFDPTTCLKIPQEDAVVTAIKALRTEKGH